jgi:integrase
MLEGIIYRNPAQLTKPPKQEKHEAKFIDKPDMNEFLNEISNDRWATAFIFSLSTGIRRSELIALKWDMLDLGNGIVKVRKGEVTVRTEPGKNEIIRKSPKSKKSKRLIP